MILKTLVACDDGNTYTVDTIKHDGGLWLVPKWRGSPYPKMRRPVRIIRIDGLPRMDLGKPLGTDYYLYKLDDPLPKAVLDGASASTPRRQLVVVEAPELDIRIPESDK